MLFPTLATNAFQAGFRNRAEERQAGVFNVVAVREVRHLRQDLLENGFAAPQRQCAQIVSVQV
jgi:hypothetical protein